MRTTLVVCSVTAALLVACAAGDPAEIGGDDGGAPACSADCDAAVTVYDAGTAPDAARDASAPRDASRPEAAPFDAALDASGGAGCADGTREGLANATTYPNVAACGGTWSGDVAGAGAICAPGWHVCIGGDAALTSISFADATAFAGCYAINAAQDDDKCHPGSCTDSVTAGVDDTGSIDMGGIGSGCSWKHSGHKSCITGGRIDASENSGTGCSWYAGLAGVVCCQG